MAARTLDDLVLHAQEMGLEVDERPLRRPFNAILLSTGLIILNSTSSETAKRYALAHECGHWHYGHDRRYQHDCDRDERQADRYAATLLVDEVEYSAAEYQYGGNLGAIASELGVPQAVLAMWQVAAEGRIYDRRKAVR